MVSTKKRIVTTCRIIDNNFLRRYNNYPRIHIKDVDSTLVINQYYRERLGGLQTGKAYELEIKKIEGKLNPQKIMMLVDQTTR